MKKTVSALVCLALLLLLVACQEPTAESAPPTSPQPSASQQTTPEPSQEDYIPCAGGYARAEFVPMEDGTEICCLVVTPEKEGQFPTVITQNCYQAATDEFTAEYFESCVADSSAFVEAGYAFVMIQTRGTANSQYESFLAYIHDTDDELQVMDWIRQQDFYNGELFCNGMSYMGFTSMSHLYAPHEDIKAISMQCPVSTRYDAWYQNGFIKIGLMGYWQAMMHRPAGFDGETLRREAAQCRLLVNCTSLGMEGAGRQFEDFSFLDALPHGAAVVDLIYAPAETELLRRAREKGHHTANGIGLLVNQAVLALERFTGAEIDPAEMKKLLSDKLF